MAVHLRTRDLSLLPPQAMRVHGVRGWWHAADGKTLPGIEQDAIIRVACKASTTFFGAIGLHAAIRCRPQLLGKRGHALCSVIV